jgi:N4-gp56 family major capsid protein
MVAGTNKIGTAPIAKSYWAVIHPDMVHDFYNDADFNVGTDFIPVERYAAHTGAMSNEIGKYRNIRFITSTNAKVSLGSSTQATSGYKQTDSLNDVYSVLIFARDAYGIIPLQGGAAKTIIHRAGGPTDPLNQRNTIGWKAATTAKILNDAWMCRLECAVQA